MKFDIKEILFRILFIHPWYSHSRKYIFYLKFTIKGSVIMKWGHGCKIWDWSVILYYFAEHLTFMLTLGLLPCRSSNLVIDLKLWENFEWNLTVCMRAISIIIFCKILGKFFHQIMKLYLETSYCSKYWLEKYNLLGSTRFVGTS